MTAAIPVRGPLKFPGYEQTSDAGTTNEQVLTYRDGQAIWATGSGMSVPTELPCFKVYSTQPVYVYSLMPLYRMGNVILSRDFKNPVSNVYTSNSILLVNNEMPCRDFSNVTNTYTDNNIQLR